MTSKAMTKPVTGWLQSPFFSWGGWPSEFVGPKADIYETDDGFYLAMDVPGMSEDSLKVRYENRVLTVSGERKQQEIEGARYHRRESFIGRFQRSFSLSPETDPDQIKAELKDGVLTIFIPKKEAAKPRQISISLG
ncbi:MAG: Hsp20/alpha crystallin family protein [Acidobacteriota bacterium]|nr:Hsp20/alpha crystallin family protein [Blastocatellia bacterium]MDW8412095.1 Hsp20/alpha crystallin family protein [Acidobacteriota bacterium]